jgi:hypothetical protein
MSADPSRAVFLSYASQDAEAARRICEAKLLALAMDFAACTPARREPEFLPHGAVP